MHHWFKFMGQNLIKTIIVVLIAKYTFMGNHSEIVPKVMIAW
jgi:hypothetical protein